MSIKVEEPVEQMSQSVLAELRAIWFDAARVFLRKFGFLRDEIAAATWRRFFVAILTTLVIGSGLYHIGLGLFYKGYYEQTLRIHFNLLSYWLVETLWTVIGGAVFDIPIILLVAYLSFHWVSHTKEENAHWIQEAHMIAMTWTISSLCTQLVVMIGVIVTDVVYHDMTTFAVRTALQNRYLPILIYFLSGLSTAPIMAYRYNLRLHGNKILNGLTGRDRWLLLGFQFVMLEGGTLFISRLVLHLPMVEKFQQSLARFWVYFQIWV